MAALYREELASGESVTVKLRLTDREPLITTKIDLFSNGNFQWAGACGTCRGGSRYE